MRTRRSRGSRPSSTSRRRPRSATCRSVACVAKTGPIIRAVAQDERSQLRNRRARDRPPRRATGRGAAGRTQARPDQALSAPRRQSVSTRRSAEARRRGFVASTTMSDLSPAVVRPLLRGSFGAPYLYANETTSTQDMLAGSDHPHGAVAVAEHQTAGRGRSGRRLGGCPVDGAPLLLAPAASGGVTAAPALARRRACRRNRDRERDRPRARP